MAASWGHPGLSAPEAGAGCPCRLAGSSARLSLVSRAGRSRVTLRWLEPLRPLAPVRWRRAASKFQRWVEQSFPELKER